MKQVIKGILYDTDEAKLIYSTGIVNHGWNNLLGCVKDELYQGINGHYFLVRHYLPDPSWFQRIFLGGYRDQGAKIWPRSYDEAYDFLCRYHQDPTRFGIKVPQKA